MRVSKYDRRHWGFSGLALLLTIPFSLFIGYAARTDLLGDNVWLTFGVFLALGGCIWSINYFWWGSLDDVHKQGQLNSWYWGGLTGVFAFILWIIANSAQQTDYGRGAIHVVLVQLGLALLIYLVWRWRGRGAAE